MERAGQTVARLARALAPHAQRIWVVCGPGNNGGDGAVAARHLHAAGLDVHVSALAAVPDHPPPADAQTAWQQLADCGVPVHTTAPVTWDLAIDAVLGIGARPGLTGTLADWVQRMNASAAPVLCVDVPSGLDSETGAWHGPASHGEGPRHTLSLLTLKPGLFTHEGRDWAGQVWWDDLGEPVAPTSPSTELLASPAPATFRHASHKGSFGDLAVVGGDAGMEGAAWLAGSAALHAGAGRVWVCLLSPARTPSGSELTTRPHTSSSTPTAQSDTPQPRALMTRSLDQVDLQRTHVVCGCGGGQAVRTVLHQVISSALSLVLDADALNAVAQDPALQSLLTRRGLAKRPTILTPHPLEAARLLDCTAAQVQADRLGQARQLAHRFGAVVVLKGSGSVIAAPDGTLGINPTGNARLATAGTGDVLAGMMGARLAQGDNAWQAATRAVFWHGQAADRWSEDEPLIADRLAEVSPGRRTASASP
jgi:hydroxyethylthiazole kinase-like uncharacterized protein yjeF